MANIVQIVLQGIDQTKAPFTTAIKNFKDVEKAASGMANILVGAGIAAAGALGLITSNAITTADEMGKLAQKVQMPVDELSKLIHAAEMADVSTDSLKGGLLNLNKIMVESAKNMASEARQAFNSIGVSVTDASGNLRSNREVLLDLADKFSMMDDTAKKSAIAAQIFGKAMGPDLLPLLNQGRDGIIAVGNEIQGISGQMAEDADNYNDNVSRLKVSLSEVGVTIAKALLPHLVSFTDWLVKLQRENGIFNAIAMTTVDTLKWMAATAHGVYTVFQTLGQIWGTVASIATDFFGGIITTATRSFNFLGESVVAVVEGIIQLGKAAGNTGKILADFFKGNFKEAWETAKGTFGQMEEAVKDVGEKIAASWAQNGEAVGVALNQSYENILQATRDLKEDVAKEFSDLGEFTIKLFEEPPKREDKKEDEDKMDKGEVGAIDPLTMSQEQMEASASAYSEYLLRLIDMENEYNVSRMEGAEQRIAALDLEFQQQLQKLAELGLAEEQSLELSSRINNLYQKKKLDLEKKTGKELITNQQTVADAALAIGQQAFGDNKVIRIAQAIIDTYAGAAKALADGDSYTAIARAAAIIAFGVGSIVATMTSTSPSGQAHDGMDFVPRTGSYVLEGGELIADKGTAPGLRQMARDYEDGGSVGGSWGARPVYLTITMDGQVLAKGIGQLSRDGRLEIAAKSIV